MLFRFLPVCLFADSFSSAPAIDEKPMDSVTFHYLAPRALLVGPMIVMYQRFIVKKVLRPVKCAFSEKL